MYPTSIYEACLKTIESLEEMGQVKGWSFDATYPVEDDELISRFRAAVDEARSCGKTVRVAIFDTIVSIPGVRVPWEELVDVCKELGILSLIDGAHGIGHIDMRHTGTTVKPDFLVTNCHK
jgi:selenocysteine lyase/cysteine desulfurase